VKKKTGHSLPPWCLWWVMDINHDEDWFIVARTAQSARRQHASGEDLPFFYVLPAEFVVEIPAEFQDEVNKGWPSNEEIVLWVGGNLVSVRVGMPGSGEFVPTILLLSNLHDIMGYAQRAVRFGDKIYREGDFISNMEERLATCDDPLKGETEMK